MSVKKIVTSCARTLGGSRSLCLLQVRHVVGPLPVLPGKKEVYYNDLCYPLVVLSELSLQIYK